MLLCHRYQSSLWRRNRARGQILSAKTQCKAIYATPVDSFPLPKPPLSYDLIAGEKQIYILEAKQDGQESLKSISSPNLKASSINMLMSIYANLISKAKVLYTILLRSKTHCMHQNIIWHTVKKMIY